MTWEASWFHLTPKYFYCDFQIQSARSFFVGFQIIAIRTYDRILAKWFCCYVLRANRAKILFTCLYPRNAQARRNRRLKLRNFDTVVIYLLFRYFALFVCLCAVADVIIFPGTSFCTFDHLPTYGWWFEWLFSNDFCHHMKTVFTLNLQCLHCLAAL